MVPKCNVHGIDKGRRSSTSPKKRQRGSPYTEIGPLRERNPSIDAMDGGVYTSTRRVDAFINQCAALPAAISRWKFSS